MLNFPYDHIGLSLFSFNWIKNMLGNTQAGIQGASTDSSKGWEVPTPLGSKETFCVEEMVLNNSEQEDPLGILFILWVLLRT